MIIRVQMVSDGVGVYQRDFHDRGEAIDTATSLAKGANLPEVNTDNLISFSDEKTYVRAFILEESK